MPDSVAAASWQAVMASSNRRSGWARGRFAQPVITRFRAIEHPSESCGTTLLYMDSFIVISTTIAIMVAIAGVALTALLVQHLPPWLTSMLTRVRDACQPRIPSMDDWQEFDGEDDGDDIEPDPADEALAAQRKAFAAESAAFDRWLQAVNARLCDYYVQSRILEEVARGNLPADPPGASSWPLRRPAEVHARRLAPRHARILAGPS
jgi:hypothetical protein